MSAWEEDTIGEIPLSKLAEPVLSSASIAEAIITEQKYPITNNLSSFYKRSKYLMKLTYFEGSEMSLCAFDSSLKLIYKTKQSKRN